MSSHSSRTKIIAGALTFSLLAGGSAVFVPSQPIHAASVLSNTPFTDVSAGHWAEKHIAKLALQGIINGYTTVNGTSEFRPAKSVTQEEAVLMALRFAGLEEEAKSSLADFPESFKVGGFFKPFIKYALDNGLLDQQEEYAAAAADTTNVWGSVPASREWVTKLLVKTVSEEELSKELSGTASSFSDDALIAANYRGYVNAALSLGLMKGVTATKFDPKSPVNRASLATLISRAQKLHPVDYAGQTTGILTKSSATSLTVYKDGIENTYTIGTDTLVYREDKDTAIALKDLQLYTTVKIVGKAGNAAYIEIQDDKEQVQSINAKFDRNTTGKYFYVWLNEEPVKISYDDSIVITDTSGKILTLDEVKRDSAVTITQDTFRSTPLAVKMTVAQQSGAGKVEGQLFNADSNVVTYLDANKQLVSKFLANNVEIIIDGVSAPTVDDLLKEVDDVELTLDGDDKVTKIKVINRNLKTLVGATIDNYNAERKMLTVFDSTGKNAALIYLDERTSIDYNGVIVPLNDVLQYIRKDRKLTITYTGDATSGKAISLQFVYKHTGTLVSINSSNSTITMAMTGSSNITIPLSTPIVEIPGVSNAYLSDLKAGDQITAQLNSSQDRVNLIKVHKTLQYEVKSVNTATKKLNATNSAGSLIELNLAGIAIADEKGTSLQFDQLSVGHVINVAYIGKLPQSVKTIEFNYGSVQAISDSSITVLYSNGISKTIALGTGYKVIKGSNKSGDASTIQIGDYVEVYKNENEAVVVTIAIAEKRIFKEYKAYDGTLWTLKTTSDDNGNFFYITGDTKLLDKGTPIIAESIKPGDALMIYAIRNKAFEITKA
ncbi:MAG: S-layer homology domain-containing protein [Candidatus Pristimantibacillus sp.]